MDFINTFDIVLEKEIFYPGETITGIILLDTKENFKLKAIKVVLRGKSHCEWKIMINGEKRTIKDEEVLIDERYLVFGNENSNSYAEILPRGQHVFQLKFYLPESQLPCSFESKFCTIRYYIKVTLDIPYASAPQGIKYFSIIGPYIDCMDQKYLKPLIEKEKQKVCCFSCSKYKMQLKCQLERSAYCCGEAIKLKASINNHSLQTVRLKIKLIQLFLCNINKGVLGFSKQKNHTVLEYKGEKIVAESRSKFNSAHNLIVPVIPPTLVNVSRLINLTYSLKIWIETDKSNEILKINLPIVIATSPFRIPNSIYIPQINYEPCCDHVEGGTYIGPEFQLGQVYDGSVTNSYQEVILYRPLYVCVEPKNKSSNHQKDSFVQIKKTNNCPESSSNEKILKHSKNFDLNKNVRKKNQFLKNQSSLDSKSILNSSKSSLIDKKKLLNEFRLLSLDEKIINSEMSDSKKPQ